LGILVWALLGHYFGLSCLCSVLQCFSFGGAQELIGDKDTTGDVEKKEGPVLTWFQNLVAKKPNTAIEEDSETAKVCLTTGGPPLLAGMDTHPDSLNNDDFNFECHEFFMSRARARTHTHRHTHTHMRTACKLAQSGAAPPHSGVIRRILLSHNNLIQVF
jgi:hypothetical protein